MAVFMAEFSGENTSIQAPSSLLSCKWVVIALRSPLQHVVSKAWAVEL